MKYFVYVIKNKNTNKIYIGQTSNLKTRIDRHNQLLPNKSTSYTSKNSGVWELIYFETYNSRSEVVVREKQLKSCRGRLFIKEKIRVAVQLVDPPTGGLLSDK